MSTTSVPATARGRPAPGARGECDMFITGQGWREVGCGVTSNEGPILDCGEPAAVGVYRLMFDVASYEPDSFFPSIAVTFDVRDPSTLYHVPLLLSQYGYTTYRGS